MEKYLLAAAILLPALSGVLCYIIRKSAVRKILVALTTLILFGVSGCFVNLLIKSNGIIRIELEHLMPFIGFGDIIKILDVVLLVYVAVIGVKLKRPLIVCLTAAQFIPLFIFEVYFKVVEPKSSFVIDYLSLVMILLVSVIGPVITLFSAGYMKEHEHHLNLKVSRQPRFFMILFVFLSAMNALVMTNNIMWMYFFWEVTTLCSFLLISHDKSEESIKNASRALWINLLGGVAFIVGIILIYKSSGTLSIEQIANTHINAGLKGLLPLGLGFLCFAGFTKSAQFPFQSWLLGAMVAPTPVSALLHSSTMVKAGVYLIVRISPSFSGTTLGQIIAVVGGFTFLAGSAIAISQRNGKRVLAYSTIANLGLIICCAGIGSYLSIAAAVLLMVFHAVSKGLLFLCVGTVELGIGSRDIEDMQGLMKRMPFTTVVMVMGMISMLLPPFGVLVTKWLSIEASVHLPLVLVFIILGSAFTVVFWAKWIGIVLTMSYHPTYIKEELKVSMRAALSFLLTCVLACSIFIVQLYDRLIFPYVKTLKLQDSTFLSSHKFGISPVGLDKALVGSFDSMMFFVIICVLVVLIVILLNKTNPESIKKPYLCGENTADTKGLEFMSPGEKIENVIVHNYYFKGALNENNLTLWMNVISSAVILILFGVVIG
ncbi:MAG: NADH-quinone oxidoreductase subunit L [Clostridiaceae bacterium]|nr:NADH-quinone oxidoreductase subunit L [Clostridiaceae bacterium]